MDAMAKLEMLRQVISTAVIVFCYVTAVLLLALVDAGLTLLLIRWGTKVKELSQLPQPDAPLPTLPSDHKVVVLGGGIRKWE
jgi:hypothetical protein